MTEYRVFRLIIFACLCSISIALASHAWRSISVEVLLADSRALLRQGANDFALEKSIYATEIFPQSDTYMRAQYNAAYRAGKLSHALEQAKLLSRYSPADAKNWLALAHIKARLGQFDQEFSNALTRAHKYARHYDGLQFSISRISVLAWNDLDGGARGLLEESIQYILNHQLRYQFLQFLFQNQKEPLICADYANTEEIRNWCDRTSKLRRICERRANNPKLTKWCAKRGIGSEL